MAEDGHSIRKDYLSTTVMGSLMALRCFAQSYNLSEPSLLTTKSGDIIITIPKETYHGEREVMRKVRVKCFVKCENVCKC